MKKLKKLQLSKETVRLLTPEELGGVVGGAHTTLHSDRGSCSCTTCPPCPDPSVANTCGC